MDISKVKFSGNWSNLTFEQFMKEAKKRDWKGDIQKAAKKLGIKLNMEIKGGE